MLPRFEIVRRLRPVDLVAPGDVRLRTSAAGRHAMPAVAPYVAAVSDVEGPDCEVGLLLGGMRLAAVWRAGALWLTVGDRSARSRRFARSDDSASRIGISLTGTHLTAWAEESGTWVARARYDLTDDLDPRDESVLAGLEVEVSGTSTTAGGFGQLGLRDVRVVSHSDGTPIRDDGDLWLTATSAGPGFFDTAHTSVWRLDPSTLALTHSGDLFFRRPDRPGVFGDHATHLVRHGEGWLVATSTWGDFEEPTTRAGRRTASGLRVILAESGEDLLQGTHVLRTRELPLPTDGFTSVATWDPHLVRRDGRWLVGFVSARRFFDFHPALASGPTLDDLALLGASTDRRATEGTTLVDVDGELVVLASDGRDGRRGQRARFPVLGTDLGEVGVLDAPYPTNLPWPTLARVDDGWLMVTFNGRPRGGKLLGYGTHGDLVVMRSG